MRGTSLIPSEYSNEHYEHKNYRNGNNDDKRLIHVD
ncbi:MAG: hypothetical protein ACI9Z3_002039 [Roseivirga sp.]